MIVKDLDSLYIYIYMLSVCFINSFFVYSGLFSFALSVPHILTNHVLSLKYFEPSAGAGVCLYIFFRIVFENG